VAALSEKRRKVSIHVCVSEPLVLLLTYARGARGRMHMYVYIDPYVYSLLFSPYTSPARLKGGVQP
jgi:hypothetical protein